MLDDNSELEGVLKSYVRVCVVGHFDDVLPKCVPIERSGVVDGVSGDSGEKLHAAGGGDTGADVAVGEGCAVRSW